LVDAVAEAEAMPVADALAVSATFPLELFRSGTL
jgi:hypothetical protein